PVSAVAGAATRERGGGARPAEAAGGGPGQCRPLHRSRPRIPHGGRPRHGPRGPVLAQLGDRVLPVKWSPRRGDPGVVRTAPGGRSDLPTHPWPRVSVAAVAESVAAPARLGLPGAPARPDLPAGAPPL